MRKISLVCCLLLAACVTTGKRGNERPMAVYDLGGPASRLAATHPLPAMAVDVHAPDWLDSLGIEYRLAYAEPARLRDYSQARWAGPPATLIQQRLIQALGFLPAGQGGAKCLLRVDIDEFSQIFDAVEQSRGVLEARLTFLDRGRHSLLARRLTIEQPAPTPDAKGGVAALARAVEKLTVEVASAQEQAIASGQLKGCR